MFELLLQQVSNGFEQALHVLCSVVFCFECEQLFKLKWHLETKYSKHVTKDWNIFQCHEAGLWQLDHIGGFYKEYAASLQT